MNRVVYDSDVGRLDFCPRCGKRRDRCACADRRAPGPPGARRPPRDGVVRISRDRKNRGGKVVTLIVGLPETGSQLSRVATDLKRLCGTGGTVRADVVEVQGDHRERIAELLRQRGYVVKLAGG